MRSLPLAMIGSLPLVLAFGAVLAESTPIPTLRGTPAADSLRRWHELLGQEPHIAGTPGDARQIERLRLAFEEMGLEVEVQEIHPLLARPISASLEIVRLGPDASEHVASAAREAGRAPSNVAAGSPSTGSGRRGVIGLDLRERNLLEDPSTAHPDLSWGWNAYSASGEVQAPVVYANFATREDFAALAAMGVDVRGCIVLARYGRNFRGDKVRFAEEAEAAGLVLFSDPADVARGPAWPEGGWSNETCVQRGSVLRKAQPGDPLTPGVPATLDAPRLALEDAGLPFIPVQPIGYGATGRILAAMTGPPAPDAWQGGLDVTYRLTGGEALVLRLKVEQERLVLPTANVIGTLRGAEAPEEFVVVGCHHDAWGFGAADPLAGTIVLMETARTFAEAARGGWRPRRTIRFAAWGAEEFGIIGSTEWCEANAESLSRGCVAYVNLDMAAMGETLHVAASPLLTGLVTEAAAEVPQARSSGATVAEAWGRGGEGGTSIGLVGGGSDHEAFQFHFGVPSVGLFAGGSQGNSYHSNYDTITWYRSVVGEDYEPALMVTRMCTELVRRLADEEGPAFDGLALAAFLRRSVAELAAMASARCLVLPVEAVESAIAALEERLARNPTALRPPAEGAWLLPDAQRWYRHALYGPSPDAGYSVETLPVLRSAIRAGDPAAVEATSWQLIELMGGVGR